MKTKVRGVLACVVVALALPILSVASPASTLAAVGSDVPPGITVTGIGFAIPDQAATGCATGQGRKRATEAANSAAVDRAVGDARGRAGEIARKIGVRVGSLSQIELREIRQFGWRRGDRRPSGRPSCRAPIKAAAATVTFAIVGGADGSAAGRVNATGGSSIEVEPTNPERNRAIKRAVLAAREAATPEAATAARREARTAARSAGLTLGGVVSVSETPLFGIESIFSDGVFYDDALGAFGPARFCRFVKRPIVRVNPKTGRPSLVRWTRKYRCSVPREYSVSLDIVYEAS